MENGKKQIAILGSTGSIGTQALDVIRERRDLFDVYALAANNHVELLIRQAREFLPDRTSPFTMRYDFVQQPSQCMRLCENQDR